MKKGFIIAGIAVVVGIIIFFNVRGRKGAVTEVRVQPVTSMNLVEKVNTTGEVKPKKFVNISSDVTGRIMKITVKEGDYVKKDQLLIKIDSEFSEWEAQRAKANYNDYQVQLEQQKTVLESKQRDYKRYKTLWESKLISDEKYEETKLAYENAKHTYESYVHKIEETKAALKSSEKTISKSFITAPIDGIVSSLNVEEGEMAMIGTMNNAGTILMTIADLSVMEVEVQVDETDIIKVKLDQGAEVKVDAYPDMVIKGTVTEVGSSALTSTTSSSSSGSSEQAKTFKTVITLVDPPKTIKPGLSASADVIIAKKDKVLGVPISAIVIREDEKDAKKELEGLFVERDGKAKFVPVQKGISGEMDVEIIKGVKEKEKVIVGPFKNLRNLKDGDPIKVTVQDAGKGRMNFKKDKGDNSPGNPED